MSITHEGFTLIEVLISIVVLAIGLLSLNAMQLAAIRGNADANSLTTETNWAADKAETLMGLSYNDPLIDNGVHDPENDGQDNDGDGITDEDDEDGVEEFNVEWTVWDDTPIKSTKTIQVTVSRNVHGVTKRVTISTIKSSVF